MIQRADDPVWKAVQKEIASRITNHQYDTWFRRVQFSFNGPERVSVSVPNRFFQTFLKHRYLGVIADSIETVTTVSHPRIEFRIEGDAASTPVHQAPEKHEKAEGVRSSVDLTLQQDFPLNRRYTFQEFVVGPSNRLAHAAARSVADKPGVLYNPLFLYGSVGLGKTHLMQAVAHRYLETRYRRVVYVSCANFTNDFIASLSRNDIDRFREKYRSADALLIDDIQFLGDKDRTQEEFFHTFNSVYNQQKQIFLSSDSLPSEIEGLEDRLVSRFRLGLVGQLSPPTLETRIAILKHKAKNLDLHIPDEVIDFVAGRIRNNVREIEGAVLRLHSLATILDAELTADRARKALADLLRAEEPINLPKIQAAVQAEFGVRATDIHSRKRTRSLVIPRHICMFLARRYTDLSLGEIGGFFGGRDHSTVLHAVEKVGDLQKREVKIRSAVESIERRLGCRENPSIGCG